VPCRRCLSSSLRKLDSVHLVCIFDHQVIYSIRVSSREYREGREGISEAILRHSVDIYSLNANGIGIGFCRESSSCRDLLVGVFPSGQREKEEKRKKKKRKKKKEKRKELLVEEASRASQTQLEAQHKKTTRLTVHRRPSHSFLLKLRLLSLPIIFLNLSLVSHLPPPPLVQPTHFPLSLFFSLTYSIHSFIHICPCSSHPVPTVSFFLFFLSFLLHFILTHARAVGFRESHSCFLFYFISLTLCVPYKALYHSVDFSRALAWFGPEIGQTSLVAPSPLVYPKELA